MAPEPELADYITCRVNPEGVVEPSRLNRECGRMLVFCFFRGIAAADDRGDGRGAGRSAEDDDCSGLSLHDDLGAEKAQRLAQSLASRRDASLPGATRMHYA